MQTALYGTAAAAKCAAEVCERHAEDFRKLVPWPPLAQSWQADADMLRRYIAAGHFPRFTTNDPSRERA